MAANQYHFITHWRVLGAVEEVAGILGDATDLARWWPAVYLQVRELAPGDAAGVGRAIDLYNKGWLPYTLRWQFRVTAADFPRGFALEASGDFNGLGVWTLEQDGPWVDVVYDWRITADKPLLRRLSFVMKPLFAANHRWAMAKGEESLRLELDRRHAASPLDRESIPPPPPPTTARPLLVGTGAALTLGAGLFALRRRTNRS